MSKKKSIPRRLWVHIDRPWGVEPVGELEFDDSAAGGFSARFRYAESWLALPKRFALDPLNLPLSDGWVESGSKYINLGVLFDAAPDAWGRQVYKVQSNEPVLDLPEDEVLLMGRGNGVGALLYSASPSLTRDDLPGIASLPLVEEDLLQVHRAAHNIFEKTPLDQQTRGLLAGSWSMGGARAKAVMRDRNGRLWIAKFSEPNDTVDRQRIEWSNLEMAREIGMQVPALKILETELGSVLLVERFDRTPGLDRLHYASAISLVSAEPEDKRLTSQRDQAIFSYARLADIINRVSPSPSRDRQELFARMVLNVCLHNTDDHLKNFGFIESPESASRLQLSPLFDVVTQSSAAHFLRIGKQGRQGSLDNAISEPRRFGLTASGSKQIVDRVLEVVGNRIAFYEKSGMSSTDIAAVDTIVSRRCGPACLRNDFDEHTIESPRFRG